ncbi:alpha/beta-hydrolase [Sodiomyces alkalinus F11]|uniref:Alpha/beta-hydrolase n=1 Tax=Sodiomyces alkalinus (strain CBS 110278 / VKM F-3762 / F11) TaxID=1314773 RepID=A0A3N2Q9N2_SODAK|nr:alpha/beta-hydrolase [Sodiomyces alkalinus F11]ROT43452.1 alpha/beta-hydrolase [Sodiomyces alkalinus F11]
MLSFYLNYRWLFWSRPCEKKVAPLAPAPGLRRHWVDTPSGNIEVLYNEPVDASSELRMPIFFIHGGMGGAWVWAEYMQYFAAQGIPCYAVSLRGHGNSWSPSYPMMVYFTTRRALEEDALAAIRWVREREGDDMLLVGHSSGGGISQSILSDKRLRVRGLALLGAIPGFGSLGVYRNWVALDPWCMLRLILQGGHPNSPLSHPALTKQSFFSGGVSDAKVLDFQTRMCRYESFLWPISMLRPFVHVEDVVGSIQGWGGYPGSGMTARVLVMTGTEDKLTTPHIMKRVAIAYRNALSRLVDTEKTHAEENHRNIEANDEGEDDDESQNHHERDERHGVWFTLVPGAGHHLQNDVPWEVGAKRLLEFYERL